MLFYKRATLSKRLTVCCAFLILTGGLAMSQRASAAETTTAAQLVAESRVLVIAHRGNSSVAPENTVPAFESAIEAGSDLIELDYYHSADGVPVTFHDGKLDRTTDAVMRWGKKEQTIGSKTLAELQTLDAGAWFDSRFAGTRIPTLDVSLDTIQNGSMTLIERKRGDAKTCLELLTAKKLLGEVVVQAFDWTYLENFRKLSSTVTMAALGSDPLTDEQLNRIKAFDAQVVAWNHKSLDADTIQRIHDRGMKAWTWTVDDMGDAERLIDAGVDGIITNVPARVRALLSKPAPVDVGRRVDSSAIRVN
jgi:glycerophosphoryl diester phosphodiesterase